MPTFHECTVRCETLYLCPNCRVGFWSSGPPAQLRCSRCLVPMEVAYTISSEVRNNFFIYRLWFNESLFHLQDIIN